MDFKDPRETVTMLDTLLEAASRRMLWIAMQASASKINQSKVECKLDDGEKVIATI